MLDFSFFGGVSNHNFSTTPGTYLINSMFLQKGEEHKSFAFEVIFSGIDYIILPSEKKIPFCKLS